MYKNIMKLFTHATVVFFALILPLQSTFTFFLTEPDLKYTGNGIDSFPDFSGEKKSSSSNLGCFLCAQLLTVTKQRVGLSQTQLKIVLNDKCNSLPSMFRTQCFTFVGDSLPQIYVSLTYDMPTRNVCQMLHLCDTDNPFANERLIEEQLKKIENIGTLEKLSKNLEKFEKRLPAFPKDLFVTPPQTTPSPFEETRQPYVYPRPSPTRQLPPVDNSPYLPPQPVRITSSPTTTSTTTEIPTTKESVDFSGTGKIPDFKELVSKIETKNGAGPTGKKSKRLTCLFCERMLNNAKSYAISSKSEIAAFANATCSRLQEPDLAEHCFQLTDRKINELAIFVDEQVVEALWCAQLNQC